MINFKKLIGYVLITFIIGNLFVFFVGNEYTTLNKPFDLPSIVFPIVWSILYLLMGVSAYIISESNNGRALKIYFIQLIFNSLWTLIFFGFNLYTLGFIWILILIILVAIMIIIFYNTKRIAGLLNIPYLLWLIFALYLNFSIVLLN